MDSLVAQSVVLFVAVLSTLVVFGQFFVLIGYAFHKQNYNISMFWLIACSLMWAFFFLAISTPKQMEHSNSVVLKQDSQPDSLPSPLTDQ